MKLKLIKPFLQSTISQKRLNGLVIISIEKNLIPQLEYILKFNDNFASEQARNINFN